jgi:hypothetical protein
VHPHASYKFAALCSLIGLLQLPVASASDGRRRVLPKPSSQISVSPTVPQHSKHPSTLRATSSAKPQHLRQTGILFSMSPAEPQHPRQSGSTSAAASVHPGDKNLSQTLDNPSDGPQEHFTRSAIVALSKIYQQDTDDDSVILNLEQQLALNPRLAPLRSAWAPRLQAAAQRTASLQRLGPSLRAFRHAFASAYSTGDPHALHGVDSLACQQANTFLQATEAEDPALSDLGVHLEPIGLRTLSELRDLCSRSVALALAERRLPGNLASIPMARLARRLYRGLSLGGQVRQVHLVLPWTRARLEHRAQARVALGIADTHLPLTSACHMLTLDLVLQVPARGQLPEATVVGDPQPILCSSLR